MSLYDTLPADTRVWIYQSQRPFTESEATTIGNALQSFVQQWVSHNQQLKAHAFIKHRQFIVLMVDESAAGASGCSIDKSVHFIQDLEKQFDLNLFDRMTFTYELDGKVLTASKAELSQLYRDGQVNDETFVFNNLVKNKEEMEQLWRVPIGQSWHKRLLR